MPFPLAGTGSCRRCLLAWWVWKILLAIIASWACTTWLTAVNAKALTPGGVDSKVSDTVFIIEGMYPWNSNGASPMVALMLAFIANSVIGKAWTQSFWSGLMEARMICMIVQFARSITPSVWGWNAVDINNVNPSIR